MKLVSWRETHGGVVYAAVIDIGAMGRVQVTNIVAVLSFTPVNDGMTLINPTILYRKTFDRIA